MRDCFPVVVVQDSVGLDAVWARLEKSDEPIGFDTEFSGPEVRWKDRTWLDWYSCELTGFSIADANDNWYVPVRHVGGTNVPIISALEFLQDLIDLARDGRRVWAHNLKVELQILKNEGLLVPGVGGWADSMVAAWLAGWGANHASLKLKKLAEARGFGSGATFAEVAAKRQARDIPVEEIAAYAGRDAFLTLQLGEQAYQDLGTHSLRNHFHEIDMPLVEIIRSIEEWGTTVDHVRIREQMDRLQSEADRLVEDFAFLSMTSVALPVRERVPSGEFYKNGNPKLHTVETLKQFELGCKISNDHQVSRWLYDELRLWPTDGLRVNGANHWPTDKETLEKFTTIDGLGGTLARMRLDWAWRDKLCKTYLKPLLELPPQYADGLLHTSLNLTGTETQRFSSSNPNLQNVPSRTEEGRMIRAALRARTGWTFIIYDYSQIELRIMAHLSRDPEMVACYLLDIDIHAGTLETMRKTWAAAERVNAKTTNFSTIYRISAASLAVKMHVTIREAEIAIEAFYRRFDHVRDYHDAAIGYAAAHGFARTLDGFKRFLDTTPKWDYRSKSRGLAWSVANEAINTPIQGSAAGICKVAMIKLWRRWTAMGVYGTRVNLAGQEHDAIIAEAREDFALEADAHMKLDMESAAVLRVPLIADGGRGPSWAEAKH